MKKAFKAMVQCVLSVGGLDVVTATGFAGAVEYEVSYFDTFPKAQEKPVDNVPFLDTFN